MDLLSRLPTHVIEVVASHVPDHPGLDHRRALEAVRKMLPYKEVQLNELDEMYVTEDCGRALTVEDGVPKLYKKTGEYRLFIDDNSTGLDDCPWLAEFDRV